MSRAAARRVEALKSLLIVLLLAAFVLLTMLCWLYDVKTLPEPLRPAAERVERALGLYSGVTVTVEGSRAETYGEAVTPAAAAVTLPGGRYAALGRACQSARRLYARLAPLIGEAAGSAGEFTLLSREAWREALASEGIYFDLTGEVPFQLFSLGLGVSRENGPALKSLLLLPGESGVVLCLSSSEGAWRARTSASAETLRGVLGEFSDGIAQRTEDWTPGALFSFEQGLEGELLTAGRITMPQASVSTPALAEPAFENLLSYFDINPHTNYRYTTAAGLRRAVDVSRVLELSEKGELRYRDVSGDNGIAVDMSSLSRMIEQLRRIAAGTMGAYAGDGTLTLRSFSAEGQDAVVTFGCTLAGAAVYPGGREAAAVFVVENGILTRAEMLLRRYTLESTDLTLLPENRAQALAGGPCAAAYFDDGYSCTPRWCAENGEVAA